MRQPCTRRRFPPVLVVYNSLQLAVGGLACSPGGPTGICAKQQESMAEREEGEPINSALCRIRRTSDAILLLPGSWLNTFH
jgi:hypothetical protein